jgi:cytochrome oxidase assembly protein ShyY1
VWRAIFGPKALALTLIAVVAMVVCIDLGRWQWDRKQAVDQVNRVLTTNLNKSPIPLAEVMTDKIAPKASDRWRRVLVSGTYLPNTYYVRGRNYHGKYGYAVLSIMKCNADGKLLWIDRGWIAAPGRATQEPIAPPPPPGIVRVVARARGLDSQDNPGLSGALFALPFKHPETIPTYVIQHRAVDSTINGYVEFISSSPSGENQPVPLDKPEITPGPHLAYAVQWYLFALLFLIGRVMLGRDEYLHSQRSAN